MVWNQQEGDPAEYRGGEVEDKNGGNNYREADERLLQAIRLCEAFNLTSTWLFHMAGFYSRIPAADSRGAEARLGIVSEIEKLAALKEQIIKQDAALREMIEALPDGSKGKALFAHRRALLEKALATTSPDTTFLEQLRNYYRILRNKLIVHREIGSGTTGAQEHSSIPGEESRLASQASLSSGDMNAMSMHYIWKDYHTEELDELKSKVSFIQASRHKRGTYILAQDKTDDGGTGKKKKPRGKGRKKI